MSEQATEGQEAVELPPQGDAAFAQLMDALAPEPDQPAAAEGGAPAGAPAATDGQPAAPAEGTQPAGAPAVTPAAGDAGQPAVPTAGQPAGDAGAATPTAGDPAGQQPAEGAAQPDPGVSGGGDRPADWTASAADLIPKIGELSQKYEEKVAETYEAKVVDEVKAEFPKYFEAIQQHPRALVGQQVPAIGREGTETIRDTQDAKDWQDAVKGILVGEVKDRAQRAMEENAAELNSVHASIELFQKNNDLVPGTKEFDVELANRFATLMKPYELRVEEKLRGWSIPVQPIIDQLRTQLGSERAAKAATGAPPAPAAPAQPPAAGAPASTPAAPAAPAAPAEPPQAGIPSKAGSGAETEDFSVLFGTIGLPNLQI